MLLAVLLLIPPWRPGRRALTVLVAVPGVFLALMIGVKREEAAAARPHLGLAVDPVARWCLAT